ncbi:MAG: 3-isopropylmalate dehydratase large subunit [Planctomycetota bacterium]
MGMTITEKIIAAHAGLKYVEPGQFVMANIDIALANDITAPIAIKELRKVRAKKVFDRRKIVLVLDHFVPNKDILSAEQCQTVRMFAKEFKILHFYEGSRGGIEHALLPEKGIVLPGDLIIGADSHTCTYGALGTFATGVGSTDFLAAMLTGKVWLKVPQTIKFIFYGKRVKWVYGKDLILKVIGDIGVDGALYQAMDFSGSVISKLPMAERFTMTNMVIEGGGKNGVIEPDKITERYISGRVKKFYRFYTNDPDAHFSQIREYDCSKIEPLVAFPHSPQNIKSVYEIRRIEIDQVVIGSCTNGWLEDLRIAAGILKGKKVHREVRLLVFPATFEIYRQALKEGLIQIFTDAGAMIFPATCGPCLGGHLGILARGERAVATTNRNFVGRMGDSKSEVYLANPAVAAASAIRGRISAPEEVV